MPNIPSDPPSLKRSPSPAPAVLMFSALTVVTPITDNSSILTPPLKVDTPRTSNNSFGCVLPIPTLLLI